VRRRTGRSRRKDKILDRRRVVSRQESRLEQERQDNNQNCHRQKDRNSLQSGREENKAAREKSEKFELGKRLGRGIVWCTMATMVLTMVVGWEGKEIHMHNRSVSVCAPHAMCMFVGGVRVEDRQNQQSGEEEEKNSPTLDRCIAAQHDIFILLPKVVRKKTSGI
jgi:hypothetical protein